MCYVPPGFPPLEIPGENLAQNAQDNCIILKNALNFCNIKLGGHANRLNNTNDKKQAKLIVGTKLLTSVLGLIYA